MSIIVSDITYEEVHPVILTCSRCGAAVSMGYLGTHAAWHYTVEGE